MDPSLLVTIFLLVTALAVGVAGLSRARISTLREDLADVRAARDDFKAERDEERSSNALKDAELQRRDAEIQTLRASLTGKVEWREIITALNAHDAKAAEVWANILTELHEIKNLRTDGTP